MAHALLGTPRASQSAAAAQPVCQSRRALPQLPAAGYFHECDVSVYQQQMQLNYMGSLHAVKAVYADMVSRNSGHICFIASTLSLLGEQQRQHGWAARVCAGRQVQAPARSATGKECQARCGSLGKHHHLTCSPTQQLLHGSAVFVQA